MFLNIKSALFLVFIVCSKTYSLEFDDFRNELPVPKKMRLLRVALWHLLKMVAKFLQIISCPKYPFISYPTHLIHQVVSDIC